MWTKQHFNAIAKDIRIEFADYDAPGGGTNSAIRGALTLLALRLATRFADDNENFDPLKFLDACSPDADMYPLSELWEGYKDGVI